MVQSGQTIDHVWADESAQELATFIAAQCAPPSTEPMWKWWESNIVLDGSGPFPGRYRSELTPMVRWLADWAQNPRVRRITGMGAAQTIKTQFLLNLFNWSVNESPGTTMWVMADADSIREFWTKRLEPAINGCESTLKRFHGRSKDLICFDSQNLLLRGSQSRAKLQSDPVKRLICDERREWKRGAIDLVRKRTRTFNESQEISVGTAGRKGDELWTDYIEGSQTMPHFSCLKCGHSQPFRFGRDANALFPIPRERGGMRWEKNETTCPGGHWNFKELRKTVRFECESCGNLFSDTDKHALIRTLHPHDYNPAAPADKKSLHWGALEFIWEKCNWGELTEEYLRAVEAARYGNIEPLIAFVTETLGEPWEDRLGVIDDYGFLETRKAPYKYGDAWAEEVIRFMAADKQERGGEHYWYVIRAFGRFGKSRLICYGRASTKAELLQIAKDNGVHSSNCMIDSGFTAQDVYRFCVRSGWKAFKGDAAEFYLYTQPAKGNRPRKTVRRHWRKTNASVYNERTRARICTIPLYTFCNDPIKDTLAEYMTGEVGEWAIPEKVGRDYFEQITAERREEKTDPKGRISYFWKQLRRDNHLWDCELMIMVAAIITKTTALHAPNPQNN